MKETIAEAELLSYMETEWCKERPFLSVDAMAYFLQFRLWQKPKDTACVVFLDRQHRFLREVQLTEGMLHRVNLLSVELGRFTDGASYLFLGHTHGVDAVLPSPEDRLTTRIMEQRFCGCPLFLAHIVVNHHMEQYKVDAKVENI